MGEKRDLWVEEFELDGMPPHSCPRCRHGYISIVPDTLHEETIADSQRYLRETDNDPEFDYRRFSCLLRCNNRDCQEVIVMAGKSRHELYFVEEIGEMKYKTLYAPTFIQPGPMLADIPIGTPKPVDDALRDGFTLFWSDLGSSANKLRIAAERLMDAKKVPTTQLNRHRKRVLRNLSNRIDFYAQANPHHKLFLDALRWVGNQGSHTGDVDRDDLITGYELMQEGLRELYGAKYRKDLQRRGKEIIARKGRPRRKAA